jgi:hypothetical protein
MSFETNKLNINGLYLAEGETIIIENDNIEYKNYFKDGTKVEWDVYMQIRPEDRLNFVELEQLRNLQA